MARLIDLLLSLNSRERGLLALLAVTAVLGLVFGGLLPLYEQRQSAEIAQHEARALEARIDFSPVAPAAQRADTARRQWSDPAV